MILKDTILSAFTDRLTLMKWLKKVEQALKESVLVDIQVNQTDVQHMTMTFVFEDGAQIATPVITLPKGEQGPQGATTKVSVGNTYTVDSNTPAMVQDVQSGDDVVLEFTIPRGERGPQGPKGDPGDGATGIDQLKNFVWPVGGTVTSAAAGADGVTYVGSASLKVGSGEAEETFEVPGILHIPLVGSDTIVIDATEDGKKVEIHLDAAVVAKLQKALTLPTETPSSFSLIGVGTNGAQRNATLGEGLEINSGNQIQVKAGAGLQIDSTDKTVAVNPGGGLTIDGGQLAVNVGSGLSLSSSGALQATGGGGGSSGLYYHACSFSTSFATDQARAPTTDMAYCYLIARQATAFTYNDFVNNSRGQILCGTLYLGNVSLPQGLIADILESGENARFSIVNDGTLKTVDLLFYGSFVDTVTPL